MELGAEPLRRGRLVHAVHVEEEVVVCVITHGPGVEAATTVQDVLRLPLTHVHVDTDVHLVDIAARRRLGDPQARVVLAVVVARWVGSGCTTGPCGDDRRGECRSRDRRDDAACPTRASWTVVSNHVKLLGFGATFVWLIDPKACHDRDGGWNGPDRLPAQSPGPRLDDRQVASARGSKSGIRSRRASGIPSGAIAASGRRSA